MISEYISKHIEWQKAFHRGCTGLVRPLFDMLVCDKCHKTLDDDSQIMIRTSAIWKLKRNQT